MPEMTPMPSFLDAREDEVRREQREDFLAADDAIIERHPWRISDLGDAEYAMRIYAESMRRVTRQRDQAKRWHQQIEEWLDRSTKDDRSRANRMSARLLSYAIAEREADPDRATIILPSGSLPTTFRRDPVIGIADKDAVLEWAKASHPDLIRYTPDVLVTTLRAAVQIVSRDEGHVVVDGDGVEVPGVEIDPPSITARVVPAS